MGMGNAAMIAQETVPAYAVDREWSKLSLLALRAYAASPRQKDIQRQMAVIEARYGTQRVPTPEYMK